MTRLATGAFSVLVMTLFAASGVTNETSNTRGPLEGTSRLGRKLYALSDSDGTIRAATMALSADPKNAELAIKLSKAQAAKRQYLEAIATSTSALKDAPKNADLYLERGHRELGLRDFKAALPDLKKAAELNPSLLEAQYHLGMVHYFLGEFDDAAAAFGRGRDLAKGNDDLIDCSNWLYTSLRRAGKTEAAANALKRITPDVKNKGPHLFFYLQLLHFYQAIVPEKEILPAQPAENDTEAELSFNTISYGVGNWHLYSHKDPARAYELFGNVVKGQAWNSWGFIGSELELAKKH